MAHEIRLNGGEIGILKTLGFSGTQMYGKILLERVEEMMPAEFIDTLEGLMSLGYVVVNIFFAGLYWLCGPGALAGAADDPFAERDAFERAAARDREDGPGGGFRWRRRDAGGLQARAPA